MGHKINPEVFRLGTSVDWKYQVRDPLLANITIYKTIKKMFLDYSAPYVSHKIRRNTNPRAIIKKEQRKNVIIRNPFVSKSFFFSHLNISYVKNLQLYIFLFDEKFEKKRVKKGIFEKQQYYLRGKMFTKDARHDFFFNKEIYLPYRKTEDFVYRMKKWWTFFSIYKNKKKRKWKKMFVKKIKKSKSRTKNILKNKKLPLPVRNLVLDQNLLVSLLKEKKSLRRNFLLLLLKREKRLRRNLIVRSYKKKSLVATNFCGAWLYNFVINKQKHIKAFNIKQNLRTLRLFLRLLPYYKDKNIKGRVFFYGMLTQLIEKILPLINDKYLKKKLFLFQIFLNIMVSTMEYKYFSNNLHVKLKKSRFLTFNLYSKIITYTLQKTCFINTKKNTVITYLGMANKNISASLLLNMLIIQLGDYINYKHILRNITKRVQRLIHIQGFRIILSGRLTRKERAAYIIKNIKSIPLSTNSRPIDYAAGFKIMKFGCVGIKIYIRRENTNTPPYWYTFRFENSLKI